MAKLTYTGVKPTDLERTGEQDTIITAKPTSTPLQHCSVKVSLGFIHFVIGRVDCHCSLSSIQAGSLFI